VSGTGDRYLSSDRFWRNKRRQQATIWTKLTFSFPTPYSPIWRLSRARWEIIHIPRSSSSTSSSAARRTSISIRWHGCRSSAAGASRPKDKHQLSKFKQTRRGVASLSPVVAFGAKVRPRTHFGFCAGHSHTFQDVLHVLFSPNVPCYILSSCKNILERLSALSLLRKVLSFISTLRRSYCCKCSFALGMAQGTLFCCGNFFLVSRFLGQEV